MIDPIKKVLDAKIKYEADWGGDVDLLFLHPDLYRELMLLPEAQLTAVQAQKLFGCDYIFVNDEGFEVLASSHGQMQKISKEHTGTDDIQLMKITITGRSVMDKPEIDEPRIIPAPKPFLITMPYYILKAYRHALKQHNVDKEW